MNPGFVLSNGSKGVAGEAEGQPRAEWHRQFEAWRRLLAECARKPSRKRVHGLRVTTLRLLAELEYWQREHGPEGLAERAVRRWTRQGQKLRRALRPVREADVYLGKLASLRGSLAEQQGYQPRCSRNCLRQIGDLEGKLTDLRKSAAKKLVAGIKDRQARLERLSQDMETSLAPPIPLDQGSAAVVVAGLIDGLAAELPELNGGNLHEFRKRVKKVRYLAELSARSDPMVARQAAALGRMQEAAGEWHDWQVLAQKAQSALRGRGPGNDLAELLETLTEESLQKALGLCRRLTAQLVRHGEGKETSHPPIPQKLPVRRAEPVIVMGERDCA